MFRKVQSTGGAQAGDATIECVGGVLTKPARPLDVGGSGTAMRFLTALAALVPGEVVIDGNARMRQRPIGPLLGALRSLGIPAVSELNNGCPPVRVHGGAQGGGSITLPGDVSSQFISAILMIAPLMSRTVVLDVEPPVVSRPYIDLTLSLMARFGAEPAQIVSREDGGLRYVFLPREGQRDPTESYWRPDGPYRKTHYCVPPDASSAAYFFGAAAITGGRVLVEEIDPADGQADARLLRVLPDLGCEVLVSPEGTTVLGPGRLPDDAQLGEEDETGARRRAAPDAAGTSPPLPAASDGAGTSPRPPAASDAAATGPRRLAAFDLDMSDAPDLVPMLAVLALFADGPSVIRGAANLRLKESDRLHALATEITRLGAAAEEQPDGLRIVPGPLHPARIETYDDHRIAMAFAIAGLAVPGGLTIENPDCVAKSFPEFWTTLATLA